MYTIGFTCGYFLASLCLRIPYVLFTTDVEVEPDKLPGAWWLGYLILSMLTFLSSLLYFVFPTALPVHVDELEGGESKPLLSVDEGALPSSEARGDNFVGNPSVVDENIKQTDASFTDGRIQFELYRLICIANREKGYISQLHTTHIKEDISNRNIFFIPMT